MHELSRLMYVSSGSNKLSDAELGKILEQSRSHNEKHRITGVLCVGGGLFVQVLEGSECDLIRLYCKIIDDTRHYDCALIGIAPISERMFDQWSMGFIQKSPEAMATRRGQLLDYRLHQYQGDVLVSAMKGFLNMLKEKN